VELLPKALESRVNMFLERVVVEPEEVLESLSEARACACACACIAVTMSSEVFFGRKRPNMRPIQLRPSIASSSSSSALR